MKDYKNYYTIKASPEEIFLALTNPLTIHLWTGEEAEMSTEPGSEFSLFGGDLVGKNIEFEKDKMIVQEWYFGEQEEASIVTIKLHPKKSQASVELRHSNIPDEDYDDIVDGWNNVFFDRLYEFYDE